jgi:choline dehydrogenase-like flavoprotein
MFVDARKIASGTVVEAEVCIIGAGAAGITLARELSDQSIRVCLLESGGLRMERETQRLYEGELAGLYYEPDSTRTRFFGGSTNCWGGFVRPMEDFHFEKRDWIPESGWPIASRDIEPFYDRAHQAFGLTANRYDPHTVLPSVDGHSLRPLPFASNRLTTSITQLVKDRRRFGLAYREELRQSPTVLVYLHANVMELIASGSGRSVAQVRIATFAGNQFTARAKIFILATGAIENARILLASNSSLPRGVGNQYDLVGRYFMEHPRRSLVEGTVPAIANETVKAYLPRYAMLRLPVAAEISVSVKAQQEERLLDCAGYLDLVLDGEESAGTLAMKRLFWELRRGSMPARPLKQIAAVLSSPMSLATFGWGVMSCSERFIRCHRITLISEQAPNPDSRIMLSHQRDRLGMNRLKVDWRMTDLDHYSRQRAVEIIAEELQRIGHFSPTGAVIKKNDDPTSPNWTWHHMGTTRMHDDPKRGVVDTNSRVHGMGNLFVAGSSVFPTAGNHTPTFTLVCLALRLSDHLKSLLARRPVQLSRETSGEARGAVVDKGVPKSRAARSSIASTSPKGFHPAS